MTKMEGKKSVFSLITSTTSIILFLNVSLSSFFANSSPASQLIWELQTRMSEILLFSLEDYKSEIPH